MNKEKSTKSREYDWLEMETKVRQFVHDLMSPFQKRLLENSATAIETRKEFKEIKNRFESLEAIMTGSEETSEKSGLLKKIEDQILLMQKQLAGQRQDMLQVQQLVKDKLEVLGQQSDHAHKVIADCHSLKDNLSVEIVDLHQSMSDFKQDTQELLKKFGQQMTVMNTSFSSSFRQTDERFIEKEHSLSQLKISINGLKQSLSHAEEKQLKILQTVNEHQYKIIDLQNEEEQLKEEVMVGKKALSKVEDLKSQLKFVQNYLQKYVPLQTQIQISQNLGCWIAGKDKRRLLFHQHRVLRVMNQEALDDDGQPDLEQHIEKVRQHSQDVVKRVNRQYSKIIKDMQEHGEQIDQMDFEDQGINSKEEKVINEDFILVCIDHALEEKFKENRKMLIQEMNSSKLWLHEMEELFNRHVCELGQKEERMKEKLAAELAQNQLVWRQVDQRSENLERSMEQFSSSNNYLEDSIRDIYNFCSIVNHLMIQDEIDKHNISLIGIKDSSVPPKNVEVNYQCLSCSGYPASVVSAFKMACLHYKPSPITIDSKNYSRKQIMELLTRILTFGKVKIQDAPHSSRTHLPELRTIQKSSTVEKEPHRQLTRLNFNLRAAFEHRRKKHSHSQVNHY